MRGSTSWRPGALSRRGFVFTEGTTGDPTSSAISLVNPSFGEGDAPDGWQYTRGTGERTAEKARVGLCVVRFTVGENQYGSVLQTATIPPGEVSEKALTFGAWVWSDAPDRVRLYVTDWVGAGCSLYDKSFRHHSIWHRLWEYCKVCDGVSVSRSRWIEQAEQAAEKGVVKAETRDAIDSATGSSVAVIIPALNEAETIGLVIGEVPKKRLEASGCLVRIVVVDNGSSDDTARIARESGAEVIVEPRRGKGNAMRTGFRVCDADFVFMVDGDCTYPATYIPEMLELLRRDSTPVVIGSRLKGKIEKGAMSRMNRIGNRLLTMMANALYSGKTSDLCTGLWGFRREVLDELRLSADRFDLEADLFIQLSRGRHSIAQVAITYRPRPTRQKLQSIRDGLRIGWKLVRERARGS